MANGEYLATIGNRVYVFNIITDEGFAFSSLGRSIEKVLGKYILTQATSAIETDVLSILGDVNKKECELYYMGKRALVDKTAVSVYSILRKSYPKVCKIPLRVVRDEASGVMQLLIPYSKGIVSNQDINKILGDLVWN